MLRIAIDQARAIARRGPTTSLAADPVAADDPVDDAERNEVRDAVWRELVRLPRKQQAALVMHDLDGYEYAEVARLLDVREKTARAHVFAARERLRRRLKRLWRGVTE